VRVGLFLPSVSPVATPEFLAAFGEAAEEAGFASLWVGEHVVFFDDYERKYPYSDDGSLALPPDNGMLDQFATLAFLAAETERIRLGTAVCLVPQRNPVYTAKEASTVDWLSNGRLDFGIGIGWQREEFDALNVPFEARADRTNDYIEVIRSLWRDDVSQHDGAHYKLRPSRMYPKPVQVGGPPIYVGGETDPALRRVARFADGWHGFNHLPESAASALARLQPMLADEGRKLADVDITVASYLQPVTPEHLPAYADAGVGQLVLTAFAGDAKQIRDVIAGLGDQYVDAAGQL
jgi:probable F420-dependent oxidoreductase